MKEKPKTHRFTLDIRRIKITNCEGYAIAGRYGDDLVGPELGRRIIGDRPLKGRYRVKCVATIERIS